MSNEPRNNPAMTFALDPETMGSTLKLVAARFTPLDAKSLRVEITFERPTVEAISPELKFGMLLIRQRSIRTIALFIHESGLWKEKWEEESLKHAWSPNRCELAVELKLPRRYENLPVGSARSFNSFREDRWPLMTKQSWIDAVNRFEV